MDLCALHITKLSLVVISFLYQLPTQPTYLNNVRFICEEFGANLFADDLCPYEILFSHAQPHLFQYEFSFLFPLHGTKCLHLHKK